MSKSGESTRDATHPRSGESPTRKKRGTAIQKILSPAATEEETILSEQLSSSSESESASSGEKKTKPGKKIDIKVIPYQGKTRANMWLETIKNSLPQNFERVMDKYINLDDEIPEKYTEIDSNLHGNIMEALMDKRAEPEAEATSLFNKLTSHKKTIQRSAIRALMYMQETINGSADVHGTNLVQEMLTLRVIHNNPEGVACFFAKVPVHADKVGTLHGIHLGSRNVAGAANARHRRREHMQLAIGLCILRSVRRARAQAAESRSRRAAPRPH